MITPCITLYVNNETVTYFDSFGIEHIPKEVKKIIGNRNIISNIYRIQNYNSIMCCYFCIGFIDYMFKGKSLTDHTNLFSPNNFKKNDDIMLNYFLNKLYKMVEIKSIERNSIESIDTPNLNNQQFRLNKISEIEEYFIAKIKE